MVLYVNRPIAQQYVSCDYILMHAFPFYFSSLLYRNILVSHTPHVNATAVAEFTVMLMLCAGRRFIEAAEAAKKWVI